MKSLLFYGMGFRFYGYSDSFIDDDTRCSLRFSIGTANINSVVKQIGISFNLVEITFIKNIISPHIIYSPAHLPQWFRISYSMLPSTKAAVHTSL